MSGKVVKELLTAVKELNSPKVFGPNHIGTVKTLENVKIERASSGLIDLDIALGGGFVKYGMIEIWGPESSGKTSLFIQVIKHFQETGLDQVAFIDHEHSFDLDYAAKCGVDTDNLLFSQPESGEDGLRTAKTLIRTGKLNLLIFDSVAAMKPRKELEGEIEDIKMSKHANMMGVGVTQINNLAKKNKTLVVWINQIREKIGVMFGSPEKTTGGNALKFFCMQRLEIRRAEWGAKEEGTEFPDFSKHRITVKKNKAGKPMRKVIITMKLGEGFSEQASLLNIAVEAGVVEKNGSWYSYNGTKMAQGEAKAVLFLIDNPELCAEMNKIIREGLGI